MTNSTMSEVFPAACSRSFEPRFWEELLCACAFAWSTYLSMQKIVRASHEYVQLSSSPTTAPWRTTLLFCFWLYICYTSTPDLCTERRGAGAWHRRLRPRSRAGSGSRAGPRGGAGPRAPGRASPKREISD